MEKAPHIAAREVRCGLGGPARTERGFGAKPSLMLAREFGVESQRNQAVP